MKLLPPSTFHFPPVALSLLWSSACILKAEPSLQDIAPTQTRLVLAQAGSGASAISSQAVQNQPQVPLRAGESLPPAPPPPPPPANPPAPAEEQVLDPRLDLTRPKNCQLDITGEQTLTCGQVQVVVPAGTYDQNTIVENPEGKRAIGETQLKPQQIGLGYIRYLSDVPLKIDGVERTGGIDVPIRKTDNLPVRIWYRKMVEPDPVTKAFSFILPPVALAAGFGAWSSGNILLPDAPPVFTEARDYYLKPLKPKPSLREIPQPSHVRALQDPYAVQSSQIRSK